MVHCGLSRAKEHCRAQTRLYCTSEGGGMFAPKHNLVQMSQPGGRHQAKQLRCTCQSEIIIIIGNVNPQERSRSTPGHGFYCCCWGWRQERSRCSADAGFILSMQRVFCYMYYYYIVFRNCSAILFSGKAFPC